MIDEFDDPAAPTGSQRFVKGMREISPAHLLINVENFSLLSEYGIKKHESRAFDAGGYKWKVIISIDKYNGKDHISMYLSIAETQSLPVGWEFNANFTFFIYNHLWDNYTSFRGKMRRFNALIPKCGFPKLISKKSLIDPTEGYLVDDNCVFGAEVFVFTRPITECLSLLRNDTAPFRRDWKISGFSKLGNVWNSEEFKVGDHKWKVELYPKGESLRAKDLGYMSIFLRCIDSKDFAPHHKVKAEVTLRIVNKRNHTNHSMNYHHWFTSSDQDWGFLEFILIADMNSRGFLVNDCCFLEIDISVQALIHDAPKI